MKISHFHILKTVADMGSFSSAAAELGCTQSNVSHAISQIEKFVGERIFVRSRSGCIPTEIGTDLIIKTTSLLEILKGMNEKDGGPSRVVRISALRSVSIGLLSQILMQLSTVHPDIRVELLDDTESQDIAVKMLEDLRADIAIVPQMESEKYISHPFVRDEYVVVLPKSMKITGIATWEKLQELNFIQHNNDYNIGMIGSLRRFGIKLKSFHKIASVESIIVMIERDLGYSIVPRLSLPAEVGSCYISSLPNRLERELIVLSRPNSMLSPATRSVLSFICEKKVICGTQAYRQNTISILD